MTLARGRSLTLGELLALGSDGGKRVVCNLTYLSLRSPGQAGGICKGGLHLSCSHLALPYLISGHGPQAGASWGPQALWL